MSPLKFSSLTSLSMRILLGFRTGQQDRTQVSLGALRLLNGASRFRSNLLADAQVFFERSWGNEVTADDRINVGQVQRIIGLNDSLGCGPGLESPKDQFEKDTAPTNP